MLQHSESHHCNKCGDESVDPTSHQCNLKGGGKRSSTVPNQDLQVDTSVFKESLRTHNGVLLMYEYVPQKLECMIVDLFDGIQIPLKKLLTQLVQYFRGIRVRIVLMMDLFEVGHNITRNDVFIGSEWAPITHPNFVSLAVYHCLTRIIQKLNVYSERKSNWNVLSINRVDIHVSQYTPLAGRSYLKLPDSLRYRHGLINLKNKKAGNCFHLCIIAALHGDRLVKEYVDLRIKNGTAPSNSKKLSRLMAQRYTNLNQYVKILETQTEVSFHGLSESRGVTLDDIDIFEANNPKISVLVFGNFDGDLQPIRLVKQAREKTIDLLLLTESQRGEKEKLTLCLFITRVGHWENQVHTLTSIVQPATKHLSHLVF